MSKAYFDLDRQGKQELKAKREDKRPEAFSSEKPVEEKTVETTTTLAPAPVEEVVVEEEVVAEEEAASEEYPLNED
jgi:hypothetical protein